MGLFGRGDKTFTMRTDLLSIGEDYWITDDDGERAYRVDGAAIRDRFALLDAEGREVATIRERTFGRDRMVIELASGRKAVVKRDGDRYDIDVEDGRNLRAHGDLIGHDYEIEKRGPGGKVAEISRKRLRLRETYEVEVEADQDPALMLAIAVAIEALGRQ
ncbi:MAG: LURP-one-related family protein [Acidimicrobiales bacterium]|nr:LURP-one-related family protein [Acidimicrobiales bacterium]HRW37486.1 LURP-one-related family protein [Aquihabitans sp.]